MFATLDKRTIETWVPQNASVLDGTRAGTSEGERSSEEIVWGILGTS